MPTTKNQNLNPEKEACRVRELYWSDFENLRDQYPIDPINVAKWLGLVVLDMDFPGDNTSGALVKRPDQNTYILLNRKDQENRRRFTCAHEIGHYINHVEKGAIADNYVIVDFRNEVSSKGIDPDEVFANRFSAALLIPKDVLIERSKNGAKSYEMASLFGVSTEALRNRMNSLGI
jgi:Zn-dependent peptidase ImmA (M78 family)